MEKLIPNPGTQQATILDLLIDGTTVSKLTVLPLRIGNLMDVIHRLRLRGWDIATVNTHDAFDQSYTKYELAV